MFLGCCLKRALSPLRASPTLLSNGRLPVGPLAPSCPHRNSSRSTVDLPLPLVPTIAQLVPAGTLKLTPLSTGGAPGR